MISKPMVRLAQTVHLSCVKISTISKWTQPTFHFSLTPKSTIDCVQNDFWAYRTFGANHAPILHRHQHRLQTEWSDIPHDPRHLGVPLGVGLKWFMRLWYVRRKPCTYLVSILALSLYRLKRASTWASSTRSTIKCIQNDFWAYCTFGANWTRILH
jgi:hypothetical protein